MRWRSLHDDHIDDFLRHAIGRNNIAAVLVNANDFYRHYHILHRTLSCPEAKKANCFASQELNLNYVVHKGLLRWLIAKIIASNPSEILFAEAPYGKPFLKNTWLRFNMSHSSKWAIYAFACKDEVGVDIEIDDGSVNVISLMPWCFSSDEMEASLMLDPKAQRRAFFKLWTRKESLSKCCGDGLRIDFGQINLGLPSASVLLEHNNRSIAVFDISSHYYAALAVACTRDVGI